MKRMMSLTALAVMLACSAASAQQINVKIGVLTDMSSLYADATGPGSVVAAKMAAADFMKDHPNVKVEIISGDHQNKPDIGSQIAKLRRSSCDQPDRQPEEQGLCCVRSCELRSDRPQMQCEHGALDLRYVDARERNR